MDKIFNIDMTTEEALFKIFEPKAGEDYEEMDDYEGFEYYEDIEYLMHLDCIYKTTRVSPKNKRAKRRKNTAKEKNRRRNVGTSYAQNPYRGKPGSYFHEWRLWEQGYRNEIKEKDMKKSILEIRKDFIGNVVHETEMNDEEQTANEMSLSWEDYFHEGDYDLAMLSLLNEYPLEEIIEALRSLKK
ncbi:MAG: hypothetical protein ACI4UE_01715 [Candidatus Scatovivens sp.]